MGQVVAGVAGAAAGFIAAGPVGAAIGFAAGMALGSLAPKQQVPRQALGDIAQQTAKEGVPRVIVWGRVRPIGGNIIHCQAPVKRWVTTSTRVGGKGGKKKKQNQETEHVYRTYAIGVCEGPITGFSRIWRNNKLVYDGRGTSWGAENNHVFLSMFRLYLGTWSQMPDPTLQSIWGTENIPAYRGTAYMVSIDEDLTELGGSVPQWQFEVERAEGVYYTSRPYAAADSSDAVSSCSIARIRPSRSPSPIDEVNSTVVISRINKVRSVFYTTYADTPDEVNSTAAIPLIDKVRSVFYTTYRVSPDEVKSTATLSAITKIRSAGYLTYNIAPEASKSTATLSSIEKVKSI